MDYQEYITADIQIASLILAEGVPFLRIDSTNPRRKGFVFQDEPAIADLVVGFWQDTHKITPRKYMGAFKELKNKLYS